MPQLDPTWFASQLFWLFVSFAALYMLLSRVMLPPVLAIMAKRKETVDTDLSDAQSFKTLAEQAKDQYERTMIEARARSQQLLTDAMLDQKSRGEQSAKELDSQIAAKLREAEKKISLKKQELKDSLTPTTAELTAIIVEKITQRTPGDEKIKAVLAPLTKGSR